MTLTEQLKKLADGSVNRHSLDTRTKMNQAIEELKKEAMLEQALKTGDTIPKIQLPNAAGSLINVNNILEEGKKVVLTFYRGGWCPYCNLELRALQKVLPEIQEKGAELIAISPETPDNSLSTGEKNELSFEVLSDQDNEVAKAFHLVFQLPEYLQKTYKSFGIDLDQSQGNTKQELPIAATYIVDTDGKIIYHFLEEDYKLRADPEEILAALS
jgi:peroxiredoxin